MSTELSLLQYQVGTKAEHNGNPLIACPMCGKSSTRQRFCPSDLDPDIYCQEMHGLGRGNGFYRGERWSVLDRPEITFPILERIFVLLELLRESGVTDDEEILDRLGIERAMIVVNQEQAPTSKTAPAPSAPRVGIPIEVLETEDDTIRLPGYEGNQFEKVPVYLVPSDVLGEELRRIERAPEIKSREINQAPIIRKELERRELLERDKEGENVEQEFNLNLAYGKAYSGFDYAYRHRNDANPSAIRHGLDIAKDGLQEVLSISSSSVTGHLSTPRFLKVLLQSTNDVTSQSLFSPEIETFLSNSIGLLNRILIIKWTIYRLKASNLQSRQETRMD